MTIAAGRPAAKTPRLAIASVPEPNASAIMHGSSSLGDIVWRQR
jgi:hypothetical protein